MKVGQAGSLRGVWLPPLFPANAAVGRLPNRPRITGLSQMRWASPKATVKTYLYRLFRKLGMNDRLDFGALWIEKPVRRLTRTGEVEGRRSAGTGGGQASCAVLGFNAGTQASRSSSGALSEVRAGPGHSLKPIPGDDCEQF